MEDSRTRTGFVAAAILLISAALTFAKTGRDALYVQGDGIYDLPKAYLGIALLAGPMGFVMLGFLKLLGPRVVRIALPLLTALALVGFSTVVRPGGGVVMTVFFMFVALVWGVVFSVSWLLAGDLLDGAPRDETAIGYALIGGAAILGGVVSGAGGRLVAPLVEPRAFLWFSALALTGAAAVMAEAQRRYAPDMAPAPGGSPERAGLSALLSHSYTWLLAAVGVGAGLVGLLVEFRFYLAAAVAGGDARAMTSFFANFYLGLNLAALVVQVWVAPKLFHRVGAGGALLVLPAALVGGAAGLAASASLLVVSTVRATEGFLKKSVHRSSWEQAYLPLPSRVRTTAKILVEGVTMRLAEGLAALVLLGWLYYVVGADGSLAGQSTTSITALLFVAAGLWLLAARKLSQRLEECEAEPGMTPGLPPDG